MILTGPEIERQRTLGNIHIEPFCREHINANSYDFRLGRTLKVYRDSELDAARDNPIREMTINDEGIELGPDRVYLGHTFEVMGSDTYVPIIRAKSGIARLGLFVHMTADLIDIGSINQWTLQLHAVQPLRVYSGMRIGQVTFWKTSGPVTLYDGKYQGSVGPQESKIHLEFHGNVPSSDASGRRPT